MQKKTKYFNYVNENFSFKGKKDFNEKFCYISICILTYWCRTLVGNHRVNDIQDSALRKILRDYDLMIFAGKTFCFWHIIESSNH